MLTKTKAKSDYLDLVAFHGLPGAGKDTAADYLVKEFGFQKFAFADALYRQVSDSFGVKVDELKSREWKNTPQNILSGNCSDCAKFRGVLQSLGVNLDTPQTSRFILRMWAHEYRRMVEPLYWVNEIQHRLSNPNLKNIVISDLRYTSTEFPYLFRFSQVTGRQFSAIEIVSDFHEPGGHASDSRLPKHQIHHTVANIKDRPEIMLSDVCRFLGLQQKVAA